MIGFIGVRAVFQKINFMFILFPTKNPPSKDK